VNKTEFLDKLKIGLKENNVQDIDEILADYIAHFEYKIEEGFTEEEIARKLGNPKDLAKEYEQLDEKAQKSSKWVSVVGVGFASFAFSFLYIFMVSAVLVLAAAALASVFLGFSLITTVNISGAITSINLSGLINNIPYFSSFVLGLSMFAFAILISIGVIYSFLYVKHWGKRYLVWCRCVCKQEKYVSQSLHPRLSKKLSSKLKLVAMICLLIFVATFAIGYFSLCISTKSFEPWHVLKWFEK